MPDPLPPPRQFTPPEVYNFAMKLLLHVCPELGDRLKGGRAEQVLREIVAGDVCLTNGPAWLSRDTPEADREALLRELHHITGRVIEADKQIARSILSGRYGVDLPPAS